jgi:tetratricopeptide (TPR) repeat protein
LNLFNLVDGSGRDARRKTLARRLAALSLAGACWLAAPAAAHVDSPAIAPSDDGEAAARREFDALFEQTLRDPANLSLTLRYAEAATRLGDFEAAITALERILFFNPALAQARLELGVLYYRLGSYGTARGYLEEARRSDGLPPELRARVDEYLARIAQSEQRHRLNGQVFAGLQHQSNANLGPSSSTVRAFGGPAELTSQFVKKADQSLFASGSALYSYDLQDQDRDAIEVTGSTYASKHFRARNLDLDYFEATAGPRSTLATWGLVGFSIRPYLIANYVQLGRDPYYHTYGGGLELSQAVTPDIVLKGVYEHREKNFEDAPDRATSRELTGHDNLYTLSLFGALTATQLVGLTLSFLDQTTRVDFQSNREFGAVANYQITYAAPFGLTAQPWQTAAFAGRSVDLYEAPDPLVDPDQRRADRRWRFGVTHTFPIADGVGVTVQLQRDIVSSSLPNFAYTSNSVLVGPQIRF